MNQIEYRLLFYQQKRHDSKMSNVKSKCIQCTRNEVLH